SRVPLLAVEQVAHQLLQMRWLRVDEELIDRGHRDVVEPVQVDAKANARQQVHGFLRGHHGRGTERPVGPRDLVLERLPVLTHKGVARMPFVLNDLWNDLANLVEDGRLALAEGYLVRDLVEIAGRSAPFAIKAANRQIDLLQGPENLFDLLGPSQGGQVKHNAGTHAGAD